MLLHRNFPSSPQRLRTYRANFFQTVLDNFNPAQRAADELEALLNSDELKEDLDLWLTPLETLEKLSPDKLNPHADVVVRVLKHPNDSVKRRALQTLEKLPKETLAKYADVVANMYMTAPRDVKKVLQKVDAHDLNDDKVARLVEMLHVDENMNTQEMDVRTMREKQTNIQQMNLWVLQTLAKLPKKKLNLHAKKVVETALKHPDEFVQRGALLTLKELPKETLAEYADELVNMYMTTHRFTVEDVLQKVDACDLNDGVVERLVKMLGLNTEDDDGGRMLHNWVLGKLEELLPEKLNPHAEKVVETLNHPDYTVQFAALQTLANLPEATLATYAEQVVDKLSHKQELVQRGALQTLNELPKETLAKYADKVAGMLTTGVLIEVPPILERLHGECLNSTVVQRILQNQLLRENGYVQVLLESLPPNCEASDVYKRFKSDA